MDLEKLMERLRAAGVVLRLAAPADAEPPPELESAPKPPVRIVGRRKVEGGGVRS